LVSAAFAHEGPARRLVHRLKYEGHQAAARVLAEAMAPLAEGASALVPVPRVTWRRVRFGVDPAYELARAISDLTATPVVQVLAAAPFAPRHAGRGRDERPPPVFARRVRAPAGCALIDDVVTTGATLMAAAETIGGQSIFAVTATSRGLALKSRGSLVEIVP
jgi:predicted amidophosphoribosyltransferase